MPISPQDNDAKSTRKRGEQSESIPRCHQVWSTVPDIYLMYVMSRTEPIALSAASLRQFSTKKSKSLPTIVMMELWEYLTNIGKDDEVLPWCRDVEQLVETVSAFNISRGRPASALKLPPQWHEEGVYKLKHSDDGKLYLIKRTTSEKQEVPKHFTTTVKNIKLVYIAKIYSERTPSSPTLRASAGVAHRCSSQASRTCLAQLPRSTSTTTGAPPRDAQAQVARRQRPLPHQAQAMMRLQRHAMMSDSICLRPFQRDRRCSQRTALAHVRIPGLGECREPCMCSRVA
jgi:hypothetical protein